MHDGEGLQDPSSRNVDLGEVKGEAIWARVMATKYLCFAGRALLRNQMWLRLECQVINDRNRQSSSLGNVFV